ncbi:MAG: hypothetical protein HY309_16585, partial [Pseudomonas fluorescens]|nr:hypothetical protein [Pseudomonas fluorescens]
MNVDLQLRQVFLNRALPNRRISQSRIRSRTQPHRLSREPAFGRWQQIEAEQADVAP